MPSYAAKEKLNASASCWHSASVSWRYAHCSPPSIEMVTMGGGGAKGRGGAGGEGGWPGGFDGGGGDGGGGEGGGGGGEGEGGGGEGDGEA